MCGRVSECGRVCERVCVGGVSDGRVRYYEAERESVCEREEETK